MQDQRLDLIESFHLVTANLPRLTHFYQQIIGCTADSAPAAIAADEMALLGIPGRGTRQTLRLGEQIIALDQFETQGRPYPPASNAASLWFQHLALVVTDIAAAYARLRGCAPISESGPQHLPPSSGGVIAFKFRDPDGHPLELLQFPLSAIPQPWRGRSPATGQIALGIDHSAISVANVERSTAFFTRLGLTPGKPSLNKGIEQQRLDGLPDVEVAVVPLRPNAGTPHLELLGYQHPYPAVSDGVQANDVAATRILWRGQRPQLLRDPDGHFQQIQA
jgi:catechol 2,3-dioxygenase-like lactoylglutathione lyase family enzyme